MAIPGWQELMMPLLELASEHETIRFVESTHQLADRLGLSEEERRQKTPSGKLNLRVRVSWAKTRLVKAGLLQPIKHGYASITPNGRSLLNNPPAKLDMKFLKDHYLHDAPDSDGSPLNTGSHPGASLDNTETPEELIEHLYDKSRSQLRNDLKDTIKGLTPDAFERLVVELLVRMGYGGSFRDAAQAIGKSNDGGIDGVIKEDRLGLDTIYLQAKRYQDQAVGRPAVQSFAGALQGMKARKGVFITTSSFASTAEDYVKTIDTKIVLIDGDRLADLMIDFDLGVTLEHRYDLKRIDADYFEEV